MIAVDTNILVYAHRPEFPLHKPAKKIISNLLNGTNLWAIPWPCVREFIATVSNPRVFKTPTLPKQAYEQIENLKKSPSLQILWDTEGGWPIFKEILSTEKIKGGTVHDAYIAALCLYYKVKTLWSADRDFNLIPDLNVKNPLISQLP